MGESALSAAYGVLKMSEMGGGMLWALADRAAFSFDV